MQEKRRHKRYNLDLIDINGKMGMTDKVEILDISLGGVALKADRRLNIGKEYMIRLQEKGKTLDVKGIVVRSELSGIEARDHGETASIYTAGLVFKDGFTDKVADFLRPLEQNGKKNSSVVVDRRLNVRFNIITPGHHILSYPLQFKVRSISLGGMLIQTQESVEVNSTIPMELSFNAGEAVTFVGKILACNKTEIAGQANYDIRAEFIDLTDEGKILLKAFIDYLAELEAKRGEIK